MTATVEPNPEATRPELTENGEDGRAPRLLGGRYGTTSLRVGAASIWLSIIVLLPLAAIVWQAAGGGWHAFWLAVTSNAALESFRVTLTISAGVTVVNLVFGLLVAWVLTRDDFPGKRLVDSVIDLPFALPTIVASLVMLALYGPNSPVGPSPAAHQVGCGGRAAVRHVAIRGALGAARAIGTRPRDRGSGRLARRQQLDDLHQGDPAGAAALTVVRSRTGLLARHREFGSVVLIGGAVPGETEVSSQWIRTLIENDDRTGAAAISIVLLVISFVVLFILRAIGSRAAKREELAR